MFDKIVLKQTWRTIPARTPTRNMRSRFKYAERKKKQRVGLIPFEWNMDHWRERWSPKWVVWIVRSGRFLRFRRRHRRRCRSSTRKNIAQSLIELSTSKNNLPRREPSELSSDSIKISWERPDFSMEFVFIPSPLKSIRIQQLMESLRIYRVLNTLVFWWIF